MTASKVVAGTDLLAADHERELELLATHCLEADAELFAFGCAGRVILDRLVLRRRGVEKAWSGGHRRRL